MSTQPYEPERFRSQAYLDVIDENSSTTQTLRITASALQQMREQGRAGYPLEICGLLIGRADGDDWVVREARAVENLNRERAADRFQLDPQAYQQIDKSLRGSGMEIVGVYHSHPDCPAKPSPTDLESAWEGFAYPIISICDGHVTDIACWAVNDNGNRFCRVNILEADDA